MKNLLPCNIPVRTLPGEEDLFFFLDVVLVTKNKGMIMKTVDPEHKHSMTDGLPTGWTRVTMVVRVDLIEKLRAFCYWERTQVKDVIEELLEAFLESRDIKPIPKEKQKFLQGHKKEKS